MKYLKAILFSFNVLIWLTGLMVAITGGWLLMDPTKAHLLNLFVADDNPNETINLLAYYLFGLGAVIILVSFFGCRASVHQSQCVLAIYMSMLIAMLITEFVMSTVLGIVTYRVISGLESRMSERLNGHYGHGGLSDIKFTHSLDYAQFKFNCCGIYSDLDYNGSAWWRDSQLSGKRFQVPATCCVLKDDEVKNTGSPMSVISRVFYKNNEKPWLAPQPKDESSCQSSSKIEQEGFRNPEGCLEKIKSWASYDCIYILVFDIVIALTQIFGTITSACLCRKVGRGGHAAG
ncbi:hypothetical protein TKK_0011417 [Trichogramma kaykai]